MKLLFLGGTRFVGRHMVEGALARGHQVTLFNRGVSNPDLFPEAEKLIGNRDGGLDSLKTRRWDAAIDVNGYFPRLVRDSAQLLSDSVGHYTFVSTLSVLADYSTPHQDEDAPLAGIDDPNVEEITGETYGGLKVLCERAAEEAFPGKTLILRPGYIVGPYDRTDRFTYWPWRVNLGGEMLAPGEPTTPLQFIDARDLAAFTLTAIEKGETGTYNCCGPDNALTWGEFLSACRDTLGSDVEFNWVSEDFLLEQGITGQDVPLWPPTESRGLLMTDNSKAIADGMTFRPISETIRDTFQWSQTISQLSVGLSLDKEADLLRGWRESL